MKRVTLLFLLAALPAGRARAAEGEAVDVDPSTRWAVVRQLADEAKKNKKLVKMLDKTVSAQVARARGTLVEPEAVEEAVAQIEAETVRPGHLVEIAGGVKAAHVLLVSIETVGGEVAVTLHRFELNADLRVTFEKVVKPNAAPRVLKKGITELMAAKKWRRKAKTPPAAASGGGGRPVFGAVVSFVYPKTAKELALKKARGAIVREVHEGGLADRIGLRIGDVVIKYGKRQIKVPPDLHAAIVEAGVGEAVPIEVWRDGSSVELEPPALQPAVATGKAGSPEGDAASGSGDAASDSGDEAGGAAGGATPSDSSPAGGAAAAQGANASTSEGAPPSAAGEPAPAAAASGAGNEAFAAGGKKPAKEAPRRKLGVRVWTVTDARAKALGLPYATGALVVAVKQGGAASDAGVEPNDVIMSIGDTTVTAARELPKVVASSLAYRPIQMEVWRDGHSVLLEVFFGIPKAKDEE
jgi:hypothetical protein